MAEEIVNVGYLRDPETHEIFLPQTDESLVTGLTDKIDTVINNKISSLDGNATIVDDTSSSLDVINTVSETDGVISSTKKTLAEGTSGKITITAPTSGTNAGKIVINHANITPVYEQNTVSTTGYNTSKETDTLVVTGIVTDYGHVARVKVEPSTNLIAADIKAPVKKQDDSTWNFRETGGDITIGEDMAKIPSLKGNTMVWNQKYSTSLYSSSELYGVTLTNNSDGSYTLNGTATDNCSFYAANPRIAGHKYLIKGGVQDVTGVNLGMWRGGDVSTIPLSGGIVTAISSDNAGGTNINVTNGTSINNLTIWPQRYDLTEMFGSDDNIKAALGVTTLEGDDLITAATNFEKLFPNSYYPYCEGRLVNLGGYGVKWNQLYDTTIPTAETGHKYYLSEVVSSTKTSSISTTISYTSGSTNRMCIDLTMMFGPGSEPTLEEFEAMFPKDYYEYDAGTEMNIFDAIGDKKLGLESTGFNLFAGSDTSNPQYIGAYYINTDGSKSANANYHCFRIKVLPDKDYYLTSKENIVLNTVGIVRFVDSNYKLINPSAAGYYSTGMIYHTPTNCTYIEFSIDKVNTNNYIWNISDTSRNGTYEPYKKDTLDLDWVRNEGVENFNIWDEEWESGEYNTSTGQKQGNNNAFRSKNSIPVEPKTKYYFSRVGTAANSAVLLWYDKDENYIIHSTSVVNAETESPENAYFARFYAVPATYGNDICINLSNPALNGEYHPYGTKAKYFPQGLLSAGSVYDEVQEGKLIKRVGVNKVEVIKKIDEYTNVAYAHIKKPLNSSMYNNYNVKPLVHSKYGLGTTPAGSWDSSDNIARVLVNTSDEYWWIGYAKSTTLEQMQADVDGSYYVYELATPIEIPLDQPHDMTYVVDDHGTEQQLPVNVSSVINAPFAGTFEYYSNFKEVVLDLMGRFNDFTPTTEIIPDSNSTLPTSQAVIDYMRAGGNGVKPVYESGDEVTPTTDVHAGLKTEVGNNSYKYYKVPFSAVTNDPSTGTSQVQIILNGNFS